MNAPKIVFILNSIQQQRCIKRIEEFISNGYEVAAYGFSRFDTVPTKPKNFNIEVIGNIDAQTPYLKRIKVMRTAIKRVIKKYEQQNVIFYYFLLDVALTSFMLKKNTYIYENSDLMYGYFHQPLRALFKLADKYVINRSLVSIMTSSGFVEYLYDGETPENVIVIPNKLNKRILDLSYVDKKIDEKHLVFSFVGGLRHSGTKSFIETILKHYKQFEIHIHGLINEEEYYNNLATHFSHLHIYGPFSNPDDLPKIYENTDIIISAMTDNEASNPNIVYAEPNKFYEAIYFRKPIVVTANSYVGKKVSELGIGFCLNDLSEDGVRKFIDSLNIQILLETKERINRIQQREAIDNYPELFDLIEKRLRCCKKNEKN